VMTGMRMLLLCLLSIGQVALAGEIQGNVHIRNVGLFGDAGKAQLSGGISVSALPLEGQAVPATPPRVKRVVIENKAFTPAFVTLRRGDTLVFENRDAVYYELFSLSKQQPFELRLGKADQPVSDHEKQMRLDENGTWHVFCRIHSKVYFRVDVVDTPYIAEVEADEKFAFTGLALGRWQLRVAAMGSEVMWVDTVSISSPPPVEITLPVMAGAAGDDENSAHDVLAIEQLFPAQP